MGILTLFFLGISFVQAGPAFISYQGRIFDAQGTPLDTGSSTVVVQVRSPDGQCLLREESHLLDMAGTEGFFKISIGLGAPSADSPSFSLSQSLSNSGVLSDAKLVCAGNSYTPGSSDHRLLRVVINGETLSPDQVLGGVPYSMNASNSNALDGKSYAQIENYADQNLAGFPLPNLGATPLVAGDSFRWDGSQWVVFQAAPADLPANSVSLDDLDFASPSGVNIPQLAAAPGGPVAGQIYYNTSTNKMMFYDGSSWVEAGSGGVWNVSGVDIGYTGGSVGVGVSSPDASALLEISSTSKGFLPPRMTSAQRIAISSPADGLIVYDTDEKALFVMAGSNWVSLGGAQHAFQVTRNGTDFTIPSSSSYQVIDFTQEFVDSNDSYNLTTNRFQPSHAGYYWLHFSARAAVPHDKNYYLMIRKNDAQSIAGNSATNRDTSTTSMPLIISGVVYLNGTTDYVDARIYQESGAPMTIEGSASYTKFSGFAISSNSSGGGADNLGSHTAIQNIVLGSHYLSGDGGNEGIRVDSVGNVGIGIATPAEKLSVAGVIESTSGGIKLPDGTLIANAADLGGSGANNGLPTDSIYQWPTTIDQLTTAPGSPSIGDVYYNTTDSKLYIYNATAWEEVDNSTGTMRYCTENENCSGTVKFCRTTTPDHNSVVNSSSHTFSFGSWSNAQCGTSGSGWYVSSGISSCSTGTGTKHAECTWVIAEDISLATLKDTLIDGDADTSIKVEASADQDVIRFETAGSERMLIDDSGNVGIGTSSPQSTLQVSGYTQLDTVSGVPPSEDCDSTAEYGRSKIDAIAGAVYVCMASGWTNINGGGSSTPSGAVMAFNLTSCPSGWSEYTQAYGRVIRGIDKSGTNIDPDGQRSPGATQEDAFKAHTHTTTDRYGSYAGGRDNTEPSGYLGPSLTTTSPNSGSTGGSETRSKNVALLYCEKD